MYRDAFELLGLDRNNCTQSELTRAYSDLKNKYQNDRFLEGERGTDAARKLDELEIAYKDALYELSHKYTIHEGGTVYDKVESYLKQGELDRAQMELDAISERGGRWHYLQASIFYKKNWMMESRKQLHLAIALEPDNIKYKETLARLEEDIKSSNPFSGAHGANTNRTYRDPGARAAGGDGDACCRACSTLICIDCCCECMGGDCITCC